MLGGRRFFSSVAPPSLSPACRIFPVSFGLVEISLSSKTSLASPVGFLQGITTNFIEHQQHSAGLFLSSKGRYLSDFLFLPEFSSPGLCGLALPPGQERLAMEHFRPLNIRRNVQFRSSTEEYRQFAFYAPLSENLSYLSSFRSYLFSSLPGVRIFQDPRSEGLGWKIFLAENLQGKFNEIAQDMKLLKEGENFLSYEYFRLARGLPGLVSGELSTGKTLPIEANFHYWNAISFTKGCYLGQETTARAHFVGQARKRILPATLRPFVWSPENAKAAIEKHRAMRFGIETTGPENAVELQEIDLPEEIPSELSIFSVSPEALLTGPPAPSEAVGTFFAPQAALSKIFPGVKGPSFNVGFSQLRLPSLKNSPHLLFVQIGDRTLQLTPFATPQTERIMQEIEKGD